MTEPLVVEMMSRKALLWRCLHGGPLTVDSLEERGQDGNVPFAAFRARNLNLVENHTDTYGACAVTARIGRVFIGHLRFYPKAVRKMARQGLGLCLQQEFPSGPAEDFGRTRFPPLEEIKDKTLLVHCMMLASGGPEGEGYRRKGIGTKLARTLIGWAAANGWHSIEAAAYEGLPVIYATSGQAGRGFWEGLGFRLVRTEREPALAEESDFVRTMRDEAAQRGMDPACVSNKYIMRRTLN
jgi:hypothetical protein